MDRITEKRIQDWRHDSDASLREMFEGIKKENGYNVTFPLVNDGVYEIKKE